MKSTDYNVDIAIIGAGPIGLFTVFQAGMLGLKTIVIDALDQIGGQCSELYPEKPIYDIPGHPNISAAQLIKNLEIQAEPFKPIYLLNQIVNSIHKVDNSDKWILKTSAVKKVECKVIIIAAGCGAFVHNRPPLEDIDSYENKSVFYSINNKSIFTGKKVVIAGGGDSALDWALTLSNITKKIYLVHRREKFKAADETLRKIKQITSNGKIELIIPFQLHKLKGANGLLNNVEVIDFEGNIISLETDYLLPFFGMKMDLGPIADWGLNLNNHHINVDSSSMQTNEPGVFAIGDIAHYQGKLKLILTGFAESALACHEAYKLVNPNTPLHFEYSTTKGLPF